MGALVVFLFLSVMVSATQSRWLPTQTHLLMPGAAGLSISPIDCNSWHFGVETNNIRSMRVVPKDCADYVRNYMENGQYQSDCNAVVDEAISYFDGLLDDIADNDVFDIDETALSNLEYYKRDDVAYGTQNFNRDEFNKWIESGKAKALEPVHRLYTYLISKKVKIVFLTGVSNQFEVARKRNLKEQKYRTMEKLILKSYEERNLRGAEFKSLKRKQLEEDNKYRIIGNIGDQWSDITGTNVGMRTFKMPNPMYYL